VGEFFALGEQVEQPLQLDGAGLQTGSSCQSSSQLDSVHHPERPFE
jgi:hypothetical protein